MVPPAVEKLWSTCASFFQRLKKADETFLREKVVETLASYGIDPAVMRERAVRFVILFLARIGLLFGFVRIHLLCDAGGIVSPRATHHGLFLFFSEELSGG